MVNEPYKLLIIVQSPYGQMTATTMSFCLRDAADKAAELLQTKHSHPNAFAYHIKKAYEE